MSTATTRRSTSLACVISPPNRLKAEMSTRRVSRIRPTWWSSEPDTLSERS
jgi:hypothetical protein